MQRQARAPQTQPFGAEAFDAAQTTVPRWLGMAGFLINSCGTTLMVDPLLGRFDMQVMIESHSSCNDAETDLRGSGLSRRRPPSRP
jgi:hypothetical protein